MTHSFQFYAPGIEDAIQAELDHWQNESKLQRLWAGDASLWTNNDESQWLGWLYISQIEKNDVSRIMRLSNIIKTKGFKHIVLLGMGGSSLTACMLAKTFGKINGNPDLQILDSTDPEQIHHLENSIDLAKTFFIVSSKSGTTLEPNIFMQYFIFRLQTMLGKNDVGDRFIAITDPGTKLESIAKQDHFNEIFYGIASIGGRYSALSNFGMVPAGLMGININEFLEQAQKMVSLCSAATPLKENPGVLLGIILGVCAKLGKNKITLITSPGIHELGAWLEQLLAESTGKQGKGLIPIDQEPLGEPSSYGNDRIFIYIRLEDAPDINQDHGIKILEQAKQIVVRLNLPNIKQLGGELFRWEIATAVVGSIIGINPFNQPDVEGSKIKAAKIITHFQQTNKMPSQNLIFAAQGLQLLSDEKNTQEIEDHLIGEPSIEGYLRSHLSRVKQGDYVNISAFIAMSEPHTALLQQCRILIRDKIKVATCLGFGPRFLHSTGQAYKGGPNSGVFLQITADHPNDIQIPGLNYSFGLVIDAQATADFEVLAQRARRVLRIHLGKDLKVGLQKLYYYIEMALK